jgi:hypothetical protein
MLLAVLIMPPTPINNSLVATLTCHLQAAAPAAWHET